MGYYAAAVGGLMTAGGAYLKGRAGDIVRNRIEGIANTPGIDTGALTGQALADQLKYLPQSEELAGKIGTANEANLLAQEEQALPGVGAARQAALGRITGLFGDSSAMLRDIARRGAAAGLTKGGIGYGGSQANQIGNLNLTYQQEVANTQLGTGLLGSLISGMRLANTPGVQAFLGPNPNQLINLRSEERAQRMALLAKAAGIPGQTAAWGDWLTQTGGALMGGGMMSGMSGGMGGAGGGGGGGGGGGIASGPGGAVGGWGGV